MGNSSSLDRIIEDPLLSIGCSLAFCYVASSWLLNRFPYLLHKKRVGPGPEGGPLEGSLPVCIAHRGGQAEAPENTIKAFQYSIEECGCEMIELDVWVSKDRKLVVVHDDDLLRIAGKPLLVSETDYTSLPRVLSSDAIEKTGAFFEFYPQFQGFTKPFGSEQIPLLEDVYKAFPSCLINVDMKGPMDPEAIRDVVALTRKYKREKRTVFGGFMQEKLNYIKKEMPEAVMAVGPTRTVLFVVSYYLGLLPFIPIWEDVFEFPVSYGYLKRDALNHAAGKRERLPSCLGFLSSDIWAQAKAWLIFALLSNRGFIEALKRRGLLILGWVVNTPEEYAEGFSKIGCHGLMTDRPKDLRRFLNEGGASREKTLCSRNCLCPPKGKQNERETEYQTDTKTTAAS